MEAWKWVVAAIAAAVLVFIGWHWFVKWNFRANRRKYGLEGQQGAVTLPELVSQIEVEEQWMRSERARLSVWLRDLSRPRFEDMTPVQVFGAAEFAEIQVLRQITELDSSDPKALIDKLRSIGSNSLAQFVRFFSRSNPDEVDVPYEVLLHDACKHLGARSEPGARAQSAVAAACAGLPGLSDGNFADQYCPALFVRRAVLAAWLQAAQGADELCWRPGLHLGQPAQAVTLKSTLF